MNVMLFNKKKKLKLICCNAQLRLCSANPLSMISQDMFALIRKQLKNLIMVNTVLSIFESIVVILFSLPG